MEWTLFTLTFVDADRLSLVPLLPSEDVDMASGYHSSLAADGQLWIPVILREGVSLREQNVMMRVEDGRIGIYLRKVFETLGFRP